MSSNKCFFQDSISHVLSFIPVCDVLKLSCINNSKVLSHLGKLPSVLLLTEKHELSSAIVTTEDGRMYKYKKEKTTRKKERDKNVNGIKERSSYSCNRPWRPMGL
jgi:hypothetical protein